MEFMATRILYNELKANNPDLASEFDDIHAEAIRIWENHDPQFTDHGKVHMDQVEENLDNLTKPLMGTEHALKVEEIFVLLSASCLHDIGMQLADKPDARARHAQYAFELIRNSAVRSGDKDREVILPIRDDNSRDAIAELARAHWTEFALKLELEDAVRGNKIGRLRLLGLLLAMADLLDISPERARYFRSVHKLYELKPLSELHQKMHGYVKYFKIETVNPTGELKFILNWRDNDEIVQDMAGWLMKWFNSQWRQLSGALKHESNGLIRWTEPWAEVKLNPHNGMLDALSIEAVNVLKAEQAEQKRIDRDKFVKSFQQSIKSDKVALFLFPSDPEWDWRMIKEWCEAHARLRPNSRVASVEALPDSGKDMSSLVAEIMEQWGEHLPEYNSQHENALTDLRDFVDNHPHQAFITIILAQTYQGHLLEPLVKALVQRPATISGRARICLLLTYGAEGPQNLKSGEIISFDQQPLAPRDVEQHLQVRCGYTEDESKAACSKIEAYQLPPGRIYTFIDYELRRYVSLG